MRSFRIVVVSHGPIAQALLSGAELIVGTQTDVDAIGFEPGQTPETLAERLDAAIGRDERPVLVLTDLYGGSPNNVASVVCRATGAQCISGVNLGLLIEALMATDDLTDELVQRLVDAARDGLRPVSLQTAAPGS